MTMPRIFVSHSHSDDEFGLKLIGDLRAYLGDDAVWYDASDGLHAGDEWWKMIVSEITERDTFLVILSPQAMTSKWVPREMGIAYYQYVKIGKKLLPIFLQPCSITADWEQIHGYDFSDPQLYTTKITQLLRDFGVHLKQTPPIVVSSPLNPRALLVHRLASEIHSAFGRGIWPEVISRSNFLLNEAGQAMTTQLWLERGLSANELRYGEMAVEALTHALDADPYDIATLRAMAQAQLVLGNSAESERILMLARHVVPLDDRMNLREVVTDICTLMQHQERFADALAVINQAMQLLPDDVNLNEMRQHIVSAQTETEHQALLEKEKRETAERVAREAVQKEHRETAERQARETAERVAREAVQKEHRETAERQARLVPIALQAKGFIAKVCKGVEVIIPPTVAVPAGTFLMGSVKRKNSQVQLNELPQQTVLLGDYRIGAYPLTVAEYACFVHATHHRKPNNTIISWRMQTVERADHPIVNVSWKDVLAYTQWLTRVTGQQWRLPTEAEWEKAAIGSDGRIYPWGDLDDVKRANTSSSRTTPVGSYAAGISPYGAYDMAGNVWEWTSSIDKPYPYKSDDGRENINDTINYRVVRGGSWNFDITYARAAYRSRNYPSDTSIIIGARLALNLDANTY